VNKISFVIWMLLFPVTTSLAEAIIIVARSKAGITARSYSDGAYAFEALFETAIWGYVGYMLFNA